MNAWHHLTFGFRAAEIWRWLIVGTLCFSIVPGIIGARQVIEGTKPAIRVIRLPGEVAMVLGTVVKVRVHQSRDRLPCVGAHSDRVMLHFPTGVDLESDNFDALVFFREGRIAVTRQGVHDFDMYLTLQSPLPRLPTGQWAYRANIYNGCAWTGRVFGGEAPIPTPTIPAQFGRD